VVQADGTPPSRVAARIRRSPRARRSGDRFVADGHAVGDDRGPRCQRRSSASSATKGRRARCSPGPGSTRLGAHGALAFEPPGAASGGSVVEGPVGSEIGTFDHDPSGPLARAERRSGGELCVRRLVGQEPELALRRAEPPAAPAPWRQEPSKDRYDYRVEPTLTTSIGAVTDVPAGLPHRLSWTSHASRARPAGAGVPAQVSRRCLLRSSRISWFSALPERELAKAIMLPLGPHTGANSTPSVTGC